MAGDLSFVQRLAFPSGEALFGEKAYRLFECSTLAHRGSGRDDNAVDSSHGSGFLGE